MAMTCATCIHWALRQHREMAKQGMAACSLGKSWTFLPPQHACGKHAPAPADIQADRERWLKKGGR